MDYKEKYDVAGVTGFINGIGYLGSTCIDPATGFIVDVQGWGGAITFWFLSSLAAGLLILFLYLREREK